MKLWRRFLEGFFSRIWFPRFKRKTRRFEEDLLEMAEDESGPRKTKAPARKGQGLTI